MGMNDDTASAARRVAQRAREYEGRPRVAAIHIDVADLAALLPVLDAVTALDRGVDREVTASGEDAGRVERMARTIDPDIWVDLDDPVKAAWPHAENFRRASLDRACAAIALADAERAVAAAAVDTDEIAHEAWAVARLGPDEGILDAAMRIKAVFDAAVRRLAEPT